MLNMLPQTRLQQHMISTSFYQPSKQLCTKSCMKCPSSTSVLQDTMRNTSGVFEEGVSKEEMCFEQASIGLFISLDLFVS